MTYHGTVKNGSIVLDRKAQLPDGARVTVEVEAPRSQSPEQAGEQLLQMTDLAVDTGISDLATNIDHYLYGHPKAGNAK